MQVVPLTPSQVRLRIWPAGRTTSLLALTTHEASPTKAIVICSTKELLTSPHQVKEYPHSQLLNGSGDLKIIGRDKARLAMVAIVMEWTCWVKE